MQRERLSKTERKVMEIIWENDANLLQSQIGMQCNERFGKDWKRQTLNTFLRRIEAKGYITSIPIKMNAYVIEPNISKKEYLKEELERLAEEFRVSKEYLKSLL